MSCTKKAGRLHTCSLFFIQWKGVKGVPRLKHTVLFLTADCTCTAQGSGTDMCSKKKRDQTCHDIIIIPDCLTLLQHQLRAPLLGAAIGLPQWNCFHPQLPEIFMEGCLYYLALILSLLILFLSVIILNNIAEKVGMQTQM